MFVRVHELAICERVVAHVHRELASIQPPPAGVVSVRLVVGQLHQIVGSLLVDAYASLTARGPAAGSTLEIATAPAVGACSGCGWRGELRVPDFRCGECASLDLELVGGKELYLEHIEILEREDRP